jgi:hypothetical protein
VGKKRPRRLLAFCSRRCSASMLGLRIAYV